MKYKLVKFKRKPNQIKGLECLNCGQPLTGNENFCSYCGQKNSTKALSFSVFLNNLFSGFFSYDSRFWRTFIPLLTKPGKVSKDYIEGKRQRFVNPFQLYLNVSIVFFLILGISNRLDEVKPLGNLVEVSSKLDSLSENSAEQLDSILKTTTEQIANTSKDSLNKGELEELNKVFSVLKDKSKKKDEKYVYKSKIDTIKKISFFHKINDFQHFHKEHPTYTIKQALDTLEYEETFWNRFCYQQTINSHKNLDKVKEDKGKTFLKTLTSYISISLFIFLPVFTLFLKLLYIRRKYTYMEHLVFVFHTQTVFFLLFTIFYFLNFFVKMQNVAWVLVVIFLIYLYKALRYFYEQGRIKTIIKFILLNSYYMFLAIVGFTIVAVLSFILG
ncbi:DUF3667 domain-containing protein [uncultured Lutibacter sp.]|uniref:DUF3667 domain-containing protein n=1 Tax=uncultured Lutibacter sp. TaxID=437739 RepID=UPI002604C054|nr:DUF3667 domain-containing protein [uncultured Lutibacter sp.]